MNSFEHCSGVVRFTYSYLLTVRSSSRTHLWQHNATYIVKAILLMATLEPSDEIRFLTLDQVRSQCELCAEPHLGILHAASKS